MEDREALGSKKREKIGEHTVPGVVPGVPPDTGFQLIHSE